MSLIGVIKQLQIQTVALKAGEKPFRVYTPETLLTVEAFTVTPEGVEGEGPDATPVIDVHNSKHPKSRNTGTNSVSFGFTGHYALMRDRFGEHLYDGVAGENIIIENADRLTEENLGSRLVVRRPSTGEDVLVIDDVRNMPPCIEFSHYANKANLKESPLAAATLKGTLQFLSGGMRGFCGTALASAVIQVGDELHRA